MITIDTVRKLKKISDDLKVKALLAGCLLPPKNEYTVRVV